MSHVGRFLFGGLVSGALGGLMLELHAVSHLGIMTHLRAIAAGSRTFKECDYRGSVVAALLDTRAWNRLVLDIHAKVIEYWPK
mmetsp:Transcript_118954/g.331878  ORF Transcript_118954/g.331878 Transcript_118954/m.331878 type:complete len:83 (-) Transcript_118954:117-365(-)